MSGYTQRVRDSILPLSVAATLPATFAEWSFTKNTVDHESPTETCGLCGQQDLRYHFEIANRYSQATLRGCVPMFLSVIIAGLIGW